MERPRDEADGGEDTLTCPECGAKFAFDEREAAERGFVRCPRGHHVEVMHGLS